MKGKVFVLICLSFCLIGLIGYGMISNKFSQAVTQQTLKETNQSMSNEINGLILTVNHVRTEPSEKADTHFVIVDLTIENTRESVYEFSMFKLTLVDEENYAYNYSSNIETKGILSGQIHPESIKRGEVAFEVPIGTNYTFVYTDHLRTGQVTWDIKL
ncbi:DUF4352 domain-containing protein [Halalkalibacter urbisdiaboli]|uniref:DUF4352 domain-containing protein n=1 Tax=Halalkalibacter urbisdiaboli TaxID=1960589 RepID=UPI000B454CBE|nr:DUF4352 domain-containing protein [Halalkalibacter urbisdiaboli]